MEKFFYEIKPYFFSVMAIAVLLSDRYNSKLLVVWGLMLLISSLYLIKRRLQHRAVASSRSA